MTHSNYVLVNIYKGTRLLSGTVTTKFIILVQNVATLRKRERFFLATYINLEKKRNYMQIAFYLNIYLFSLYLMHSFFNGKLQLKQLKTNILSTWQQNFMFSLENFGSDIFLFLLYTYPTHYIMSPIH